MLFFEASAKEDTNVGMMFRRTARAVLKNIEDGKVNVGDPRSGVKVCLENLLVGEFYNQTTFCFHHSHTRERTCPRANRLTSCSG